MRKYWCPEIRTRWGEVHSPHAGILTMRRKDHTSLCLTGIIATVLFGLVFATACQSSNEASLPTVEINQPVQETQREQEVQQAIEVDDSSVEVDPPPDEALDEPDPAAIEEAWQSSPHAAAFVQDPDGKNNACARCHAPINWAPSMDDLPESCYACKFELEQPPAYIPEDQWESIPCNVCHQPDKKGNIQPEIQWLEIAALEEYSPVETVTELCMKCHGPTNLPEHVNLQVEGAHAGFECTQCHDAHAASGTCGGVDCHEDVLALENEIPGHDTDHQEVGCSACHDGTGAEIGPSEERGMWITLFPWTYETDTHSETGMVAFTSHNLVLEASCERCHFAGNAWGLSEQVESP